MKNNKSIFIAIAPNHISNFENIIKNSSDLGDCILLNPGSFSFNNELWLQVINGELDLLSPESSLLAKIKYQKRKIFGYKSFINKFHKETEIPKNISYNYYYCNLDDILSNYVFNYLLENKLTIKNYAVEDGVLNYYYPTIELLKLKAKKYFCKYLVGIKFVPEKNHPTGIDSNNVKAQFVRLPNKAIYPEKSVNLPFPQINYIPIDNVILIIGQDINHNNPEGLNYYKQRVNTLFSHVREQCDDNTLVVYKPHRLGDVTIAENILKDTFINYKMYKDITPIEECITKIGPKQIFSFESSALLNLKIAFNGVNVDIACLPYGKHYSELMIIFKDLGIKILE